MARKDSSRPAPPPRGLAEKRRILQLETLYDLALALRAEVSEQELLDELLLRACAVLDPAAAVAVTRDGIGRGQTAAVVGWPQGGAGAQDEEAILALVDHPAALNLPDHGAVILDAPSRFGPRPYRQMLASSLRHRDRDLGFVAVFDKESRGEEASTFTADDRKFLASVAALSAVPLDNARAMLRLEAQRERLEAENQALKDRWSWKIRGEDGTPDGGGLIVARAPNMRRALDLAERVAPRGVSVLLQGESGTGKELVARLLHFESQRTGPLIAVNCAALPESLLESELFGIEGGVATGVRERPGKFQLADGGTLFLDEIGDVPASVQVRLLRALQEKEVLRVGGRRPIAVDVRIVTATHRDLTALVDQGEFREDLYYRLKGVGIELPPLRHRRQDIPHLVRHFAERFCHLERIPLPPIDSDATARLMAYPFPGNVRELQNIVEGAISLAQGRVTGNLVLSLLGSDAAGMRAEPPRPYDITSGDITSGDISGSSAGASGRAPGGGTPGPDVLDLRTREEQHIRHVLRLVGGNKSAAARMLGIDRRTLARKGF